MPQGPDGKTIIVVKKVVGHGGHHRGSGKLAYAAVVTSMMCLFMVLWLVNSASVVTRERIASYFRRPGVFEVGSGAPIELNGAGILPDAFAPPGAGNSSTAVSDEIYEHSSDSGLKNQGFPGGPQDTPRAKRTGEGKVEGGGTERGALERALSTLEQTIREEQRVIAGLIGKMSVKLDQRGLHLEIMDTDEASMFERGSARILPLAEAELKKIAAILADLPNPIDIEGHTDAVPFRNTSVQGYDNWNLSTDRANAARRVLESAGVKGERIARVAGYAAQRPRIAADPRAASNRRITISMRYTDQAAAALSGRQFTESRGGRPAVAAAGGRVTPEKLPAETTSAGPLTQPAGGEKQLELEREEITGESGLGLELKTTLPETAPVDSSTDTTPREIWMEKDKIFGFENPFLRK